MSLCALTDLGAGLSLGGCLHSSAPNVGRSSVLSAVVAIEPERVYVLVPHVLDAIDLLSADATDTAMADEHLEPLLVGKRLPWFDGVRVMNH
jgi:hypothetical protein